MGRGVEKEMSSFDKREINMDVIVTAKQKIERAEALIIGAGAGMGVDSGLPDFRGGTGFWRAYPPLKELGISFVEMANPAWFLDDPRLAWGFYGHRYHLYRKTKPHTGFDILRKWGMESVERGGSGAFIFTSNVDGQFQKAGFREDQILECHGSIHHFQCTGSCTGIWPAKPDDVCVDDKTMRAVGDLPRCPGCGSLARPAILMFGDWHWNQTRSDVQTDAFNQWLNTMKKPVVLIEIGAGTAVPTVRIQMERLARMCRGTLIRINRREPEVPEGHTGLALGGLEALTAIDKTIL
jgi:NAD-dependent SIR2 family protein deacetylase